MRDSLFRAGVVLGIAVLGIGTTQVLASGTECQGRDAYFSYPEERYRLVCSGDCPPGSNNCSETLITQSWPAVPESWWCKCHGENGPVTATSLCLMFSARDPQLGTWTGCAGMTCPSEQCTFSSEQWTLEPGVLVGMDCVCESP